MEENKMFMQLEDVPVKYFKMMNGDSIVAYVHDTDIEDAVVALEEPMIVTLDEESRYLFTPWFPFSKNDIHLIDVFNVMAEDDVDDDVKDSYLKLVLLDKSKHIQSFIPTNNTKH
jgi:hypothetical protein